MLFLKRADEFAVAHAHRIEGGVQSHGVETAEVAFVRFTVAISVNSGLENGDLGRLEQIFSALAIAFGRFHDFAAAFHVLHAAFDSSHIMVRISRN